MVLYEIDDIRRVYASDLRFLRDFLNNALGLVLQTL